MSYQKIKISPKSVSIVLKPKATAVFTSILPNLCSWLNRRKISVNFLETEEKRLTTIFKSLPKYINLVKMKEIHTQSDLIISLGGDGTLIGVSRLCTNKSPPVLGVNMGRLGFITEFSRAELYDQLELVLKEKVEIAKINLYKTIVTRKDKKIFQGFFLNDAVVSKNEISRMFSLTVESNDEHLYDLSGDGLIVSSPIGSTAYSLAAGGPILHPFVGGITLTPICPHSLTHRPLIVPDNLNIDIRIPPNSDMINLTLDGQEFVNVQSRDTIKIQKSNSRYIKLINNPERTYFQTLKEKFTHGRRN
jgi:NAD+ kinase